MDRKISTLGIWITWERQRRNIGISRALGWQLFEIITNKPRLVRYLSSIIKTISIILQKKRLIVVVQNPSKILTLLGVILSNIFDFKLIVDAHNSGVFPREGKNKLLMVLSRFLQKSADLTLVTNDNLKLEVEKNKGTAFVLPDKIPTEIPVVSNVSLKGKVNVGVICTFNRDEPYKEMIEAANLLPKDICLYFTGRFEGKIDPNTVPDNVLLQGFMPEQYYWNLLSSVDLVMDLTLREDCLVCGAYEGLALEKPMILSDTTALKSYFHRGCVYVQSDRQSIAKGIEQAVNINDQLYHEITELKNEINLQWDQRLAQLEQVVHSMV